MELLRVANNTVPSGNQITNVTAKTYFADNWPLPSNTDNGSNTGRTFRVQAFGYISSLVTTPGTLTLALNVGTTAICSTAAIQLPAVALSNAGFKLDAVAVLCTSGTSGKWSAQGFVTFDPQAVTFVSNYGMVNTGTAATGQISINTNTAALLQLSATFSVQSASNIITATQILIYETP